MQYSVIWTHMSFGQYEEVRRMRKAAVCIAFCFWMMTSLFALQGCTKQEPTPEPEEPAALTAADYFPVTENTKYVYEGEGMEFASLTVFTDYTSENQIQQRVDNTGTVMAQVITIAGGKATMTYSSGEAYYRENCLEKTNAEEVLLAEPIQEGTQWTLSDGRIRKIGGTAVAISTPAGNYETVEVITESADSTDTRYYAKGVGLVKAVYQADDYTVSSTLASIENDMPLVQTVRFYFPNVDTETIYYAEREITLHTNDITADALAAAYKEVPDGVGKVISENTVINSLTLDNDGIPHIDLNRAFLTEMNAGSGYEAMILSCIADTFGGYYNADRVILTVDGALYESGHFAFAEGETIAADFEAAVLLP
jgi:hypothetical protein